MRMKIVYRWLSSVASIAVALACVPAASSFAAPAPGVKLAACYATADVENDMVLLSSEVACEAPHAVQVIGGAALPATFSGFSLAQLLDQKNTNVRAALTELSEQICSGTVTAPVIWPKQGAAMASALTGLAATTGGGVLPGLKQSLNFGWAFPDEAAFNAGDRSMLCLINSSDPKTGKYVASMKGLQGNVQLIGTGSTLATMRACSVYKSATKSYAASSCAKPHADELIAHFVGVLPADVAKMTAAQWAPFDAQCQAIMDVLVGAKRTDLKVVANPATALKGGVEIYVPCFVSRVTSADGTRPNLPAGTVVGLGKKPLKAA
ncbi:MAG: septum formation family protein [Actinomycetota bacterium]|nr:septum formation family protein [Actinomycetota bacterium]